MNYTQQELADLCQQEITDFIDEYVLPDYADGTRSAEVIVDLMADDAKERLELAEIDCTAYYARHSNIALVDPYIALSQNRKILVAYIQTVFDGWRRRVINEKL